MRRNTVKYFDVGHVGRPHSPGRRHGPERGCTTKPITPLTDVSVDSRQGRHQGRDRRHVADRQHQHAGGHGLGLACAVEQSAVHRGRPETEKGNDKVVIVLTDGANTYYHAGG